jgi:hypothetical protein
VRADEKLTAFLELEKATRAMTLIEISRIVGAGKCLKLQASSQYSRTKMVQSVTLRAVRDFVPVRFAFWIRAAS